MVSEGTAIVVRQLVARGRLSKANVEAIVANCSKPFSWRELRQVALCGKSGIVLRSEHALLSRLTCTRDGVKVASLAARQRLMVRMAAQRLNLVQSNGRVYLKRNWTEDTFLEYVRQHPGLSLAKLAIKSRSAPKHIASLWSKKQISTHDGCVWGSPGPAFSASSNERWHTHFNRD